MQVLPWMYDVWGMKHIEVVDVGCSKGIDAFCLAAVAAVLGVKIHITGYDMNATMLAQAQEPYVGSKRSIEQILRERQRVGYWRSVPLECLDFFENVGTRHVQPTAALRATVTFAQPRDMLTGPLPILPQAHAVILNNVPQIYSGCPNHDLETLLTNSTATLSAGGILSSNVPQLIPPDWCMENNFELVPAWQAKDLDNVHYPFFMREPSALRPPASLAQAFLVSNF